MSFGTAITLGLTWGQIHPIPVVVAGIQSFWDVRQTASPAHELWLVSGLAQFLSLWNRQLQSSTELTPFRFKTNFLFASLRITQNLTLYPQKNSRFFIRNIHFH